MKQPRAILVVAAIAAMLGPVTSAIADDGLILALSCAACHGPDGKSPGSIPTVSGKSEAYIEKALMEFKTGQRPATVMNRLAKGYTDDEIKALAKYFAGRN